MILSGTEAYKETHNVTTTNLGLFNIRVGTGTSVNGIFSEIAWGSSDHFLQIEIDSEGGNNYELIGSSQLMSVPYALHAENGSKWDEVDGGILYEKEVNVGAYSPDFFQYDLNIRGEETGNTGLSIINSNPESRNLLLLGESNLQRYIYVGYLNSSYEPQFSAYEPESGVIYTGGNNGLKFISNNGRIAFTTGGLEAFHQRLVIETNGNVGIGTATADAKLQVTDGDVYIENVNRGVIMKAPNGGCWRMTVSNSGEPVFSSVACPD